MKSKKESQNKIIQLDSGTYKKCPYFFWFDLEARAEILAKISLLFGDIWRHQKDILKLSDL